MNVEAGKLKEILKKMAVVPDRTEEPTSSYLLMEFSKSHLDLAVRGAMMGARGRVLVSDGDGVSDGDKVSFSIILERDSFEKFLAKLTEFDKIEISYTDTHLEAKAGKVRTKLKRMAVSAIMDVPNVDVSSRLLKMVNPEDAEQLALAIKYLDKTGVYAHVFVQGPNLIATNKVSAFSWQLAEASTSAIMLPAKLAGIFGISGILRAGPGGLCLDFGDVHVFQPRHLDAKPEDFRAIIGLMERALTYSEKLCFNGDDLREALRGLSTFEALMGARLRYEPGDKFASVSIDRAGSEVTYDVGVEENQRVIAETFLLAAWLPFVAAAGSYVILRYSDDKTGPFSLEAENGAQLVSTRR